MLISVGKNMRYQVLKNLLSAHGQIADSGNISGLIALTKLILKLSKQFDDEFFELGQEEQVCSAVSVDEISRKIQECFQKAEAERYIGRREHEGSNKDNTCAQ